MANIILRRGPHGIPLAVVEPPHELIGEFLTAEGSSLDSWACADLSTVLTAFKRRELTEFHKRGDAHTVHMTPQCVTIFSEYRIPSTQCVLPLDAFQALIDQWKCLLAEYQRKRVRDR